MVVPAGGPISLKGTNTDTARILLIPYHAIGSAYIRHGIGVLA